MDTRQSEILALLQSTSLVDLVQATVVRRIRDGDLTAGAHVNELALAEALAVSRGPIREALRSLVGAGLLEMKKNRGFFVREIDADAAREIYLVRAALDRLAGETLAPHATEDQISELASMATTMEAVAARGDVTSYYPLNLAFHRRILELAGNRCCARVSDELIDQLHLFRRRGLFSDSGLNASTREHREIIAALASRDGERAGQAMRDHVLAGWERANACAEVVADPRRPRRRRVS